MNINVILKDLRSKISYKGIMETEKLKQSLPLMIELTGTSVSIGFQTAPITGWMQDLAVTNKLYIFDSQGGRFFLQLDQGPTGK
jgi:hypothetical protein